MLRALLRERVQPRVERRVELGGEPLRPRRVHGEQVRLGERVDGEVADAAHAVLGLGRVGRVVPGAERLFGVDGEATPAEGRRVAPHRRLKRLGRARDERARLDPASDAAEVGLRRRRTRRAGRAHEARRRGDRHA